MSPARIVKRDGQAVAFDQERIAKALRQALQAARQDAPGVAEELARVATEHLVRNGHSGNVGLEDVQDACVLVLQGSGHYDAAVAFIRYRDARERQRRERIAQGETGQAPNLVILDSQLRRRPWSREWCGRWLTQRFSLTDKASADALHGLESLLAGAPVLELTEAELLALAETALLRLGLQDAVRKAAPICLDRQDVAQLLTANPERHNQRDNESNRDRDPDLDPDNHGVVAVGRRAALLLSLQSHLPAAAVRHWRQGRLWIDGLDDPTRGSRLTMTAEGAANPWQVITQAFASVDNARSAWRQVRLVLPPSVLGHLERGAQVLVPAITALARQAQVFLYCDGRTPLLEHWPFAGVPVGLATWNQDFLLEQQLEALGQRLLSGAHLLEPGPGQAILAECALNAQGLDGEYALMDDLALAAAGALACRRRGLLASRSGEFRCAVYGLPHNSPSRQYLEQAVSQEGRRLGLEITRASRLCPAACAHLGQLLEDS